ncbi:mannose-6-phosphate isomerase [Mesobacillus campisalis]|uniref:Mannose-6-phosphate isomerase n=1 Tax=Mesobacillus campisalis TaxID=1408103 RepID=A0A0M2SSI8_9BACI|nr:mannose-6-phosphate isomerase [Mesobacillus campisalis]
MDERQGKENQVDGHFPEEWIMSVVEARNKGREHLLEGLSVVAGNDITLREWIKGDPEKVLGKAHHEKHGSGTGVLVKIIDSAERLTVQVHPDRKKAEELFFSSYGKTECWHILGGRAINGVTPYVYLGFKPGVTREQWEKLFWDQDIEGMLNCLHRYEVKPGDTFLIEGGTPHAIGSGCFLVEIQEPTDYTFRIEKTTPSGFRIDDFMCHQGIGFDRMFDCFNYEGRTREDTLKKWKIPPCVLQEGGGKREVELIGYKYTPYFGMTLLEVEGEMDVPEESVFSGMYILSGKACFTSGREMMEANAGEQYFLPADTSFMIKNRGNEPFRALRFRGPESE